MGNTLAEGLCGIEWSGSLGGVPVLVLPSKLRLGRGLAEGDKKLRPPSPPGGLALSAELVGWIVANADGAGAKPAESSLLLPGLVVVPGNSFASSEDSGRMGFNGGGPVSSPIGRGYPVVSVPEESSEFSGSSGRVCNGVGKTDAPGGYSVGLGGDGVVAESPSSNSEGLSNGVAELGGDGVVVAELPSSNSEGLSNGVAELAGEFWDMRSAGPICEVAGKRRVCEAVSHFVFECTAASVVAITARSKSRRGRKCMVAGTGKPGFRGATRLRKFGSYRGRSSQFA